MERAAFENIFISGMKPDYSWKMLDFFNLTICPVDDVASFEAGFNNTVFSGRNSENNVDAVFECTEFDAHAELSAVDFTNTSCGFRLPLLMLLLLDSFLKNVPRHSAVRALRHLLKCFS